MIQFNDVNKWHGDHHALVDITETIPRGEVVVVCAPSGSGKSTLIRTINRALDPEMVGEVLGVMRDLMRDGMTAVAVTHEMGFARAVAHRVLFMDQGRILERAEPHEFFDRPQHARARQFLSDIRTPFAQAAQAA